MGDTAHRQRAAFVLHVGIQCRVGMKCGRSSFGLAVVEAVSLVWITVVGSQVEIHDDFHLLGQHLKRVLFEEHVADGRDGVKVELQRY